MKLTPSEFFDLVKVIRMLYGVKIATYVYEKNMELFTGFSPESFANLVASATMESTREN